MRTTKKPPHYHRDGLRHFSTARSLTQESGTFEGTRDFLRTTRSFNSVFRLFLTHLGKHWTDNYQYLHLDPIFLHRHQIPCKPPAWSAQCSRDLPQPRREGNMDSNAPQHQHHQSCCKRINWDKSQRRVNKVKGWIDLSGLDLKFLSKTDRLWSTPTGWLWFHWYKATGFIVIQQLSWSGIGISRATGFRLKW